MNEITITVSGKVGSGKSAMCGEIEILCRALGIKVEWVDGQQEKNLTHADWTEALEMYKPEVTIIEHIERAPSAVALDDERPHPFAELCALLPADVNWGDSLTPDIARHIARAAPPQATSPVTYEFAYGMSTYEVHGSPEAIKALQHERASNQKIVERALSRAATATQPALTDAQRDAINTALSLIGLSGDPRVRNVHKTLRALLAAAQPASDRGAHE